MKKLQEAAKKFFEEEKYNLIILSDQCKKNPLLPSRDHSAPTGLLLAMSTMAQGGICWRIEKLEDVTYHNCLTIGDPLHYLRTDENSVNALDAMKNFLYFAESIGNGSYNAEREKIFEKIIYYIEKLDKYIIPHLDEVEAKNLPEVTFTEYPPHMDIFLQIYQNDRNQTFFKSTGIFSQFFWGKYQEMHLRINSLEFLNFEKVLEYGVTYPKSRTARILQKYFKTYWGEAKDKPLKDNLSQKNNPNVLDGVIIKDLQPIVNGYLFGS